MNMKKMECKKRVYTMPEIEVYPVENDNLLKTVSVTPNGTASNAAQWDADQEVDGGSSRIRNSNDNVPAKNWGNVWEEEEE